MCSQTERRHAMKQYLGALALAATMMSIGAPAAAQLLIGQTSGFTGPVAAGVKENTDGAKLYIDSINVQGGVHGQPIQLVSADDKFDPALSVENAKTLIVEKRVLAMFLG